MFGNSYFGDNWFGDNWFGPAEITGGGGSSLDYAQTGSGGITFGGDASVGITTAQRPERVNGDVRIYSSERAVIEAVASANSKINCSNSSGQVTLNYGNVYGRSNLLAAVNPVGIRVVAGNTYSSVALSASESTVRANSARASSRVNLTATSGGITSIAGSSNTSAVIVGENVSESSNNNCTISQVFIIDPAEVIRIGKNFGRSYNRLTITGSTVSSQLSQTSYARSRLLISTTGPRGVFSRSSRVYGKLNAASNPVMRWKHGVNMYLPHQTSGWSSSPCALQFNSLNKDYALLPFPVIFGNQARTYEFWINRDNTYEAPCFLLTNTTHCQSAGTFGIALNAAFDNTGNPGAIGIFSVNYPLEDTSSVSCMTPNGVINSNAWVHVVITYDGSYLVDSAGGTGVKIYINAEQQITAQAAIAGINYQLNTDQSHWIIGAPQRGLYPLNDQVDYYHGKLGIFRAYSTDLSLADIEHNFEIDSSVYNP